MLGARPEWRSPRLERLRLGSSSTRVHTVDKTTLVVPLPRTTGRATQLRHRVVQFAVAALRWLHNVLDRLPGQCTVSKLDALHAFQRETSPGSVALIMLLTPVPCVLVNLLLECIPLNDPADGFWASGYFQLRMFSSAFLTSLMPSLKKLDCVPESPVSSPKALLLFALSQACIGVLTNAAISLAADVFPVPFSQFAPIIPMTIAGRLLFYRHLPTDPQFHAQSDKVNLWLSVEVLPVLIYPAFTVAFMALTPTQQFWVSFLLPLLRIALRRVIWWTARDDHDLIAVMTCCVAHLYHVLFIAMVLQNSKSLKTMGVVVFLGVSKMLLNCHYILSDAKELSAVRAKLDGHSADYFALALGLANEPRVAKALHRRSPSLLLSTYPSYRRVEFLARHQQVLQATPWAPTQGHWLRLSRILPWEKLPTRPRQATVHTIRNVLRPSILRSARSKSSPSAWAVATREPDPTIKREAFVRTYASALHHSQIVMLKAYVTICMTAFYGACIRPCPSPNVAAFAHFPVVCLAAIYLIAVFWLPNHQYFATQAAMTTFGSVGSTLVRLALVCGMEIAFAAIYLALIRRHLGVSGVYGLAFVLRSQRVLVQAQLIQLTVAILAFPLTHFGNDSLLPSQAASGT
jgi:hypothetical protein